MLPSNNLESPPSSPVADAAGDERPALARIVPVEPNRPYDIRAVITELVDDGDFVEPHEHWAPNVQTPDEGGLR